MLNKKLKARYQGQYVTYSHTQRNFFFFGYIYVLFVFFFSTTPKPHRKFWVKNPRGQNKYINYFSKLYKTSKRRVFSFRFFK